MAEGDNTPEAMLARIDERTLYLVKCADNNTLRLDAHGARLRSLENWRAANVACIGLVALLIAWLIEAGVLHV
jgi:hypothetical protein